jgi:hypothetical protein
MVNACCIISRAAITCVFSSPSEYSNQFTESPSPGLDWIASLLIPTMLRFSSRRTFVDPTCRKTWSVCGKSWPRLGRKPAFRCVWGKHLWKTNYWASPRYPLQTIVYSCGEDAPNLILGFEFDIQMF